MLELSIGFILNFYSEVYGATMLISSIIMFFGKIKS
jgi:hypothetical protein